MMEHMKPAIINMIEQGYSNAEIAKAMNCSNGYVRNARSEYNKLVKDRKRSLHRKPKPGTKSRLAYDYLVANPKATTVQVQQATGVNCAICFIVRSRYSIGANPPHQQSAVANQVKVDELEIYGQ